MIHLLVSLAAAAAVAAAVLLGGLPWAAAAAAGLAVLAGVNFLLGKRLNKIIGRLMDQVAQELKQGRMDRAVRLLEGGLRYGRYQFFVASQLKTQIGVIRYIQRDFAAAFPYLEKAFVRNWVAQGMLAVLYMRRKNKEAMVKTFERAVRYNPKEGLLWNLYAYCLVRTGDRPAAIQVLVRAAKKLPGDERVQANLIHLQNNRKMKMKNYGELWLQFHLEKTPGTLGRRPPYPVSPRRRVIRR